MLYVVNSYYEYAPENNVTYLEHDKLESGLAERAKLTPYEAILNANQWHDYFALIAFDYDGIVKNVMCQDDIRTMCYRFIMEMLQDVITLYQHRMLIPSFITKYIDNPNNSGLLNCQIEMAHKLNRYIVNLLMSKPEFDPEKIAVLNFIEFSLAFSIYYSNDMTTYLDELLKYLGKNYVRNRFNEMYEKEVKRINQINHNLAYALNSLMKEE